MNTSDGEAPASPHIVTVGDVLLDIIVDVPGGLSPDDDSEARITLAAGGQAANVAAWACALGARATLVGPRGADGPSSLVRQRVDEAGIDFAGIYVEATGTVVSIVTQGTRTLASDAGDLGWVERLDHADLPMAVDWIHESAYPLLRSLSPEPLIRLAQRARAGGARVSLDLSSASLLEAYGVDRFRDVLAALRPDLVFANASEWGVLGWALAEAPFDVVLKEGPQGARVASSGHVTDHPARVADVIDATGAGDALAAGYLVGGADLAMRTAARCVSQLGAQPRV